MQQIDDSDYMKLYNTIDSRVLKEQLKLNTEPRTTISFYRYIFIQNPSFVRDYLYIRFMELGVLGRIYLAQEGVNAQISVPNHQLDLFRDFLDDIRYFEKMRLNIAVDDSGKSFFKLMIKVREKIVADGLDFDVFATSGPAPYLSAAQFNELTAKPGTILVDMRNHYESEIGHFESAWCPDVDTFREQLVVVREYLEDKKDVPVIMYCTGGIRCEKASAYMKYHGFNQVYHIEGGIIKYSRDAAEQQLPNKYIGKNFVFDERMSECITDEVIAHCHQCGTAYDVHTNCKNKACNQLLIQCPSCAVRYSGCCSDECAGIAALPEDVQRQMRKGQDRSKRIFTKGRYSSQHI